MILPVLVTVVSSLLLTWALRSRQPGWIGLPFALIAARVLQQCGLNPLLVDPAEYNEPGVYTEAVSWVELPSAIGMILLGFLSIGLGMWLVILARRFSDETIVNAEVEFSRNQARLTSWLLFLFGLACNLFRLRTLTQQASVWSLASTRAPFTDMEALSNPFFSYLALLSNAMPVGAWGLLIFARRDKAALATAILCNIACCGFHVLYGSRQAALWTLVGVCLIYHYGVRRLTRQQLLLAMTGALFAAVLAAALRTQTPFGDATVMMAKQALAGRPRVLQAGSIQRLCPSQVPFQNGSTLLGGLSHVLPGLDIPGAENAYYVLVTHLLPPEKAALFCQRGGGETLPASAECYMNFGWVGVVVVPMVFGVIFSLVFEFQRRRPKDPFVLMLAVGVFLRFLPNMDAKMVAGIASLPISTLLPVGTLAAFAKPRARSSRIFMVFCFAAALFTLIAWRLVELESLKYATQAVLLLAYVGAAWAIWSPDTPPTTANPARKMGFAASRAAVRWDTRANTPEAWRTHLD